jgi:Lon protease-like protein
LYNIPRPAHSYFRIAILVFAGCCTGVLALPGSISALAQSPPAGRPPAATALPATIPIFPLPDVMLFPHTSVPLHIFEPRYRAMVADALKGDRIIGMVLLRPGYEPDYERSPSIFPVGSAGVIEDVEVLDNGEYNILLRAIGKFRIGREVIGKPYRMAVVTAIPEVLAAPEKTALQIQRRQLEMQLAGSAGRLGLGRIPSGLSDEELVDGVAQNVDIDPLDRLKLLEAANPLTRARALAELLDTILATPP